MTADVSTYLDGNAAAGTLREVFAETRVYLDAPGPVARCSGCDDVLLRVVTTPTDTYLRFSNPS